MKKIIGLCVFCMIMVSCQKNVYTYDVSQTVPSNKAIAKKTYPLYVQMAYRGIKKSNKNGKEALKFDLLVQNMGAEKVTLAPTNYYLLDEEKKRLDPLVRKEHKNLTVAPETSTLFPVFYTIPNGYEMDDSQILHLLWDYNVESQKYEMETKFDRRMIREKDYFGYPISQQFYQGPKQFRRLGPGPLWRYQKLENRGFRNRRK
ncbi:hypothetical protein [Candidatus Uabimicrobium sp. HlEnr_7]|uniref:hypothetical protein n=1 Tax=Candidatus Uabimicrobium helgolandensis TaxID=3095367 RepID=UPI003555EA68